MSGIAGIVLAGGGEVSGRRLERLVQCTPNRGPDGEGAWRSGPCGLVRFHHATTPEAIGERQPVQGASGKVICFDGRLDNRGEILGDLGASAPPPSSPDCALVLALFERYGDEVPNRLVGDYAFAIWQPDARRLFCARSPVGWRPFLWTFDGRAFAFATQLRTLLDGLRLSRRVNEGAVGELLSLRFVTQTETLWQGVQRLPPGAALVFERGAWRSWRWNRGPYRDYSRATEAEQVERFRELFDKALVSVTRSTTPVISQLSGGLDSSSVVCRATELHRQGRLDQQIRPITIRYPGEPQDETKWSSAVERHLGVDAIVVPPARFDLEAATRWSSETLALPLRPNVMMSMSDYLHDKGARVLLTGEGGDDWLWGHLGHWPDLVRSGRWIQLAREASELDAGWNLKGRIGVTFAEGLLPLVSKRARERAARPHLDFDDAVPSWINAEWAARIGLRERWRADTAPAELPTFAQHQRHHVYAVARMHLNHENVVNYADSRGIELRHPFHDFRLTRFLMGAAGHMLLGHGQHKYLLREAMRGTLPEVVRTRPSKANFVPTLIDAVSECLAGRSARDLLCVRNGWVDGGYIARSQEAYDAWRKAGCAAPAPEIHYGAVWFAVAVDLWLRHAAGV